ncbi:MFS transporter fmqE [Fulvia fulva]|uniref:MFS transporter fmqE n=1 Tax=Passalora fulva TaxID=5499 RepID=A0A9Q8PCJ3_PASFU|nr:MFS transporter fmqE [Fulvia fulva]UJO19999.1 MFS transporter fmqE [Fulvia fulva]
MYPERIGRRSLWLVGSAVNMAVMAVIGGLGFKQTSATLWAVGILIKNQSIAVLSNSFTTWLFNFTVPYMYNVDSGNLGAKTGLVFAGASVLLLLASYPLIPDLRGLSTVEVDRLYESRVSPRGFQQHRDSGPVA